MRSVVAAWKFFLFFLLCLFIVTPQILILFFTKGDFSYILPKIFHACASRIFGIHIIIQGKIANTMPCIFVSNHISYLDIPVIGSVLRATFVAKEDVSGWPLFGFLATLQQTLFISRERSKTREGQDNLSQALQKGKSLILFPEGTSTDGREVLPFKSSLFSLFLGHDHKNLIIQPFTIILDSVNGQKPNTQSDFDLYAWHIKMDTPLPEHLWRFAQSKGAIIRLVFHAPLNASSFTDRKELAKACQETVSKGLTLN